MTRYRGETFEVVLVTLTFWPDIDATSKLMLDLAEDLGKSGLRTLVIAQNRSYQDPRVTYPQYENHETFDIQRVQVPLLNKNMGVHKLLLYSIFGRKVSKVLERTNTGLVLGVFPPFLSTYKVLKTTEGKGCPFVLILHDLHPDTAIRRGQLSKRSLLAKVLKNQTYYLMSNSEVIVTLGRDVANYIEEEYKVERERIKNIPNWGRSIQVGSSLVKTSRIQETNRFTVLYAGNFGEASDFMTLLEAADKIKEIEKAIHFDLVGNGRKKQQVIDIVKEKSLDNISFHNFLPEEDYIDRLLSSSAFVLTLRPESKGMSVPSKLYYYLAAGKPIVAIVPKESEIDLAIKEDGFGISCPNGDLDCVANGLIRLKRDKQYYDKLSERTRAVFQIKYKREVVTKKYVNLVKELIK